MFNRKTNYLIPNYSTSDETNMNISLERNHEQGNVNAELYYNQNFNFKQNNLQIGDRVIAKQNKLNKFTPMFKPIPYRVTDIRDSMIATMQKGGGKQITRNILFYKKISEQSEFPTQSPDIDIQNYIFLKPKENINTEQSQTEPTRKQYPEQYRRPVSEWRKY